MLSLEKDETPLGRNEPCSPVGASYDSTEEDKCYIDIAFINNMPDSALEATERQFLTLIGASAGLFPARLKRYSLPDIPRTPRGREYLRDYLPIAALGDSHHDALIMTGTEPREPDLTNEPYWPALTQVVEWAQRNVNFRYLVLPRRPCGGAPP